MTPTRPAWIALPLLALGLAATPARADHDNLDEALRSQAGPIVQSLRKHGYQNVGVLKFLVRTGDGPFTDNAGELNLGLANRLEVALILANPDEDLGIIHQASRTVAASPHMRANHLTPGGRKRFFDQKYELAWGEEMVQPDAFLTGEVTLKPDLTVMTVLIKAFDKDGEEEKLAEFTVPANARALSEAGYNYYLPPKKRGELLARGPVREGGKVRPEVQQEVIKAVPEATGREPDPDAALVPWKETPVKLHVYYGDSPQSVAVKPEAGRAWLTVPEPKETDEVRFVLENPSTQYTYAVVLKVNGENSLFRERSPERECHKWVLAPGQKVAVNGFQRVGSDRVGFFKVRPPEVSEANAVRYGEQAGTFRMTVFQGQVSEEDPTVKERPKWQDAQAELASITRGTPLALDPKDPAKQIKAGTLKELKANLRSHERKPEGARGLIEEGPDSGKKEIKKVFFRYDFDAPLADVTVRYYTPKPKKGE